MPRLPLRDLNWQSHAGPLRSIHTLHVELNPSGTDFTSAASPIGSPSPTPQPLTRTESNTPRDDGFQSVQVGARAPAESVESLNSTRKASSAGTGLGGAGAAAARRHQIPGLRRTPYLKVLLVRCDDSDTYKATTRSEIREWIKTNAPPSQRKSISPAENHDAFEWLIVHVVIPNTVAATQPRVTGKSAETQESKGSSSRWRGGSSSLLEKLRNDFNSTGKNAVDRVAQIRIGINDVPYDLLPRVVPAVPTGYHETEHDADIAWQELIGKLKSLILSSFDMRVSQYEDDIKEKDAQRSLPGWNFCTFFILKEGLARGFESVGLVEDALVGYDELSVGLDTVVQEQAAASHGAALLTHTSELKELAQKALNQAATGSMEFDDQETVDLQAQGNPDVQFEDIPIASTKKPYRELILANNVSVFDFRCYIFARQISLLLRLGNAWSTREELLAKLKEQQESVLHGVAPRAPPPKQKDEGENLSMLAEICRRTLEFIPSVSGIMRRDVVAAFSADKKTEDGSPQPIDSLEADVIDNIVASFAFSVAQQILAQTSTKALPIPPSTLAPSDGQEPKAAIPEPKTRMHPARSSSLHIRTGSRPPQSSNTFPIAGRPVSVPEVDAAHAQFLKAGLEDLAARRAELYALSRNILEGSGKRRGWSDGWASVPLIRESDIHGMEEVSLDDTEKPSPGVSPTAPVAAREPSMAGVSNELLRTALDNQEDFYRLYETLTDKALRHYTVASYNNSVQGSMADLAILQFHLQDYGAAASYFYRITPFFGENGWSLLELSMLVMYAKCLKELKRKDEYVRVLLKLLTKASIAEREKTLQATPFSPASHEPSAVSGYFEELLTTAASLEKELDVPLEGFFCEAEIENAPDYHEGQDSFSVTMTLRSLLVDEFEAQSVAVRILGHEGNAGAKEIWLRTEQPVTLKSGRNKINLRSDVFAEGRYEADRVIVSCNNVSLHHQRDPAQQGEISSLLKKPSLALHQRMSSLGARLLAGKEVQLDKNNSLELEVSTGWNTVKTCEIKIKAAAGGLRLLMSEASTPGSFQPAKTTEGGLFAFSSVPAESTIKIRFPFTTEQDLLSVAIKVEVAYTTERGNFSFHTTPSVPIALALGVNVQDIFKHHALFSRFTVSTASESPLRLFSSELQSSQVFESHFGAAPSNPILVFPKQPASLLYKVTRKPEAGIRAQGKKTMYLKLCYTVVLDEIEAAIAESVKTAAKETPLREFAPFVVSEILAHVKASLTAYELERAALLGQIPTSFISDVQWEKRLSSLGQDAASNLANLVVSWLKKHPKLFLTGSAMGDSEKQRCILIPVDIPPITIVHSADIRLSEPPSSATTPLTEVSSSGAPVVCINQLLPATLHLKWTRLWDTGDASAPDSSKAKGHSPYLEEDLEFSYEVTAPIDTWLLAGRRKGHFVIPGVDGTADVHDLSSGPGTEADIPLVLVPLREGWLPYPNVEVREVKRNAGVAGENADGSDGGGNANSASTIGHCETDYRNLGETVRVIADRARVTLSLDASGPGGGPLVLESERADLGGSVVA